MSEIAEGVTTGERAAAISNLVVKLMREYTGRGPSRARAHISDNVITVVLHETLTKSEQNLVRDGERSLVLNTRSAIQAAMREAFVAGVEEITGETVGAFMSANHVDPDLAVEIFVLDGKPAAGDRWDDDEDDDDDDDDDET
jgi:uncharacterized protein YbcI